jgi:hypothetical protein
MAAATSGEPASLETFADVCCTMMLACERAGDIERPQQWSAVLEDFVRKYDPRCSSLSAGRAVRMSSPPTAGSTPRRRNWCMMDGAGLMRQLTEEPVAARA